MIRPLISDDALPSDAYASLESPDSTGDSAPIASLASSLVPLVADTPPNFLVPAVLPSAHASPSGIVVLSSPYSLDGIKSATPDASTLPHDD